MIELKVGSIFDQKADLVVIPCNSIGGVTSWVLRELRGKGLPSPSRTIPYGKVQIEPTHLDIENAEYIAYAASVSYESTKADMDSIISICQEIKYFLIQEGIEIVNLPLLGTGAGGLAPLEVYQAYVNVFTSEGAEKIRAITFTPSRDIYIKFSFGNQE